MLQSAELPDGARKLALKIFERLAQAEGRLHGVSPEVVHFHEVGAVDAIVDSVGTSIAVDWLSPTTIPASPVPVPRGFVQCAHGKMPLPAPATLELLKGATIVGQPGEGEWVTPTGAAIVSTLAEQYGAIPPMVPAAIGYGVGDKDPVSHANLLRLVLGEPLPARTASDTVVELEATLDDMLPEWHGALTEMLLSQGALDCWLVPVQMKKGRPGVQLTVLCKPEDEDRLTRSIFQESTTLGLRRSLVQRSLADRQIIKVDTAFGELRVKVATYRGRRVNVAPEYEDCLAASVAFNTPLKEVYSAAVTAYRCENR